MQSQRSTSEPFCEVFEFETGSSSSNLGLDQQGFQNNDTLIALENQNISAYPLSSDNSNIPSGNVAGLQSEQLISWMTVGPSSSSHTENPNNHTEVKIQNDWASSSLTSNRGGRQPLEERQTPPVNMFSSESLDLDLNINHIENFQPFSQVSDLNGFNQNVGLNTQVSGSGFYSQSAVPGIVQPQHASTSSGFTGGHESSSRSVHNFQDTIGNQQGLLLGGRCSLHKRKGIDLVAGQSSTSGSSSNMNRGLNMPHEDISTRLGIATRVPSSDPDTFSSATGNQESFMRNTRMRTNQPVRLDSSTSNTSLHGNVVTHANNWSAYQSSTPVPSDQLLESSLLGGHVNPCSQPNVSTFSALSSNTLPILRSVASASRVGSSSNPLSVTGERNAIEEPNLRTLPRSSFADHPAVYPAANNTDREQDSVNAGIGYRAAVPSGHGLPGLRARSVFAAYQPPGTSGASSLQRRRLPDIRRSIHPPRSEPRGQNVNLPLQTGHFSAPLEFGRVPTRVHLPSLSAVPPILPDRQSEGAATLPFPVRHLGRNRNSSEMISMADVFRRIDPSLLEDVLLFEQSVFFGAAAEFHDRHRELRLDVDNMSYEELLALEERIGNVNTGLDEEKIKKCLKQRKYLLVVSGTSQDEPCCICQEEYVEGEDLGQLDCGHDFHTACIKQWLLIKNSCPICKNNALKHE